MERHALILAVAVGACGGALVHRTAAQSADAAESTTASGVYTAAQATRGEETYFSLCVSCHPIATQMGTAFSARWQGRPLAELFDQVKINMPKNDPGSLTPEEAAQVVAYILKLNAMPAGKTELDGDGEALKKIRIKVAGEPDKVAGPAEAGRYEH